MVHVAALAGIGVNNFHRTNLALHDVHWCMLGTLMAPMRPPNLRRHRKARILADANTVLPQ